MSLEDIKQKNRLLKTYNESVSIELENICAVFTIIFSEIIGIGSNCSGQEYYLKELNAEGFPKNKIGNTKNKIFEKKEIKNSDVIIFNRIIDNYFSNKNNGLFNREKVVVGIRLLEELDLIKFDLIEHLDIRINEWNSQEIGKIIKSIFEEVLFTYSNIRENDQVDIKTIGYKINQAELEKLMSKEGKYHLKASNEFFNKLADDLDKIREIDVNSSKIKVDTVFNEFMENDCDEGRLSKLTDEEYYSFVDAAYRVADIFDKTHDDKSYVMQVNLLKSINNRFLDDYSQAPANIIRKIIGLTYGIAICPVEKQSDMVNLSLSGNGNIIIGSKRKKQSLKERLDCCLEALLNISDSEHLGIGYKLGERKILDVDDIYDYSKIKAVLKNTTISKKKTKDIVARVKRLNLLALFCSDIAAIHMNYLKPEKNPEGIKITFHHDCSEVYQMISLKIRFLLLEYANVFCNKEEVDDFKMKVINSLSNIASLAYNDDNYAKCLIIRKSIFLYCKEKRIKRIEREAKYINNCRRKTKLEDQYDDFWRKAYDNLDDDVCLALKCIEPKSNYSHKDFLTDLDNYNSWF